MKIWKLNILLELSFFLVIFLDRHFVSPNNLNKIIKQDVEDNSKDVLEKYLSVKYKFWKENIRGKNVKIGIVDSGIKGTFCNISKIYNFSEESEEDQNGHGTYISSIICHYEIGVAPESSIFIYKIFDKDKKTMSEKFAEALDQIYNDRLDILNLSFGGISFNDEILIEKLRKIESTGTLIISSSGNDGPSFGTINFPGNLPFIITVGATSKNIFSILRQSSRGPAIVAKNFLINKPNTWAPGENILGLDLNNNYTYKNGSSSSAALVTGYLSLLVSKYYENRNFFNLGKLLIILKESNLNFPELSKDELFSGIFSLDAIFKLTEYYINNPEKLKSQILNNLVDFSLRSFSNYSMSIDLKNLQSKSLYSTMQPIDFNLLLINPNYQDYNKIYLNYTSLNKYKQETECLDLKIKSKSKNYFYFRNFVGVLQMSLEIKDDQKCKLLNENFDLEFIFYDYENNTYPFRLIFDVVPTPNRISRILISRFHNLFYPFDGLIPKDNLYDNWYNYDWTYESLDTNYFSLFSSLKQSNFFVEESNLNLDCIDLNNYSLLIFIDVEYHLTDTEIQRIRIEYENNHLSLLFITDWNHPLLTVEFDIVDPYGEGSSNFLHHDYTGGSHLKSFNKFLHHYGIEISEDSISKTLFFDEYPLIIKSASSISKFPAGSYLFGGSVKLDKEGSILNKAILGLTNKIKGKLSSGRLGIFTDSYCLDDYQLKYEKENCIFIINSIIKYLIHGDYSSSKLRLSEKQILNQDYRFDALIKNTFNYSIAGTFINKENCPARNYSSLSFEKFSETFYEHIDSDVKTSIIANIINKPPLNLEVDRDNKFINIFEDFLYVLAPILTIIFLIILLIYCRHNKIRRVRIRNNLSQLKVTSSVEYEATNPNDSTCLIINNLV